MRDTPCKSRHSCQPACLPPDLLVEGEAETGVRLLLFVRSVQEGERSDSGHC
jgi:hypothetical protein